MGRGGGEWVVGVVSGGRLGVDTRTMVQSLEVMVVVVSRAEADDGGIGVVGGADEGDGLGIGDGDGVVGTVLEAAETKEVDVVVGGSSSGYCVFRLMSSAVPMLLACPSPCWYCSSCWCWVRW